MPLVRLFQKSPGLMFASRRSLISVSKPSDDDVAIVTLNRPPVNALNIELLNKISDTFSELSQNDSVKGIILKSFSNKIFSSGLDLNELQDPTKIDDLGAAFRNLSANLYGSVSKPFVACVSGHAPAGGTLLSMCADYRVATPNSFFGLNESAIGIVVPVWMSLMYENLIGPRRAELALMLGSLYGAEEAFKMGLVDEIAKTQEAALEASHVMVRRLIREPENEARHYSKMLSRERVMTAFDSDLNGQKLASFFKKPTVQANIKLYANSLKKSKK